MDDLQKLTADQLRERFKWKKVEAPRAWRPRYNGEDLVGYYGGKSVRNGAHGQYEVVIVHVPARGAFTISGVRAVQLADTSMMMVGSPMRIVFKGMVSLGNDHSMKEFELFIPEGEAVPEAALPSVGDQQ